jgi:hydrogenase-4 component E
MLAAASPPRAAHQLFAALLLLLAFAMLAQRRVVSLITLFAAQGLRARAVDAIVATPRQPHLYWSWRSRWR